LVLVPMLTSIFVITYALEWRGTPYLVAGFLLLTFVLLAYDLPKLVVLIGDRDAAAAPARWRASLRDSCGLLRLASSCSCWGCFASPRARELGLYGLLLLLAGLIIHDWTHGGRKSSILDR
jgi:hypothetical protein